MKNIVFGLIALVVVATAVGGYSADEHKSGAPMGAMMQGMKGMMGEQSHDMMPGMKDMMAMMGMCSQMMASKSDQKKEEPSK
jgi:hypothetical protein